MNNIERLSLNISFLTREHYIKFIIDLKMDFEHNSNGSN